MNILRILLLMPARHYRMYCSVAGKGMDTETCLDKREDSLRVPIKDSM